MITITIMMTMNMLLMMTTIMMRILTGRTLTGRNLQEGSVRPCSPNVPFSSYGRVSAEF